ncbi:aldolase/citrate lyase family protein [Oleiagrimonas sp.]|jgi:2-keto-3-deoxy-L-rhamnonate aldolase RhmA|uniref:HpcH/HpaI aldolase family protein n=1 Tax=Oleiagrimonas sp. TaxID=2010330 RepID=UPI00260C8A8E|nr:aldolase/citrate lyase family protein [Oleiagrimonas sp.]MDA3913731.1 aldolase/citrate lyase family protein [Oleiagrimonas sp.]
MTTRNRFKAALDAGQSLQGVWSMSGSPTIVEALGHVGADYVVLDLEHSPTSIHGMLPLLQASRSANTLAAVRMSDHSMTSTKHALDLGANTLMFPFVQDATEAAALVAFCHYPPNGQRGYALMTRASDYLADKDYLARASDDLLLIMQVETTQAVANVEKIAQVSGVGAIFVGPGDLSASMGHLGNAGHPDVRSLMAECAQRVNSVGLACGTVMGDAEQAAWAFEVGYRFVAVGTDMALLCGNARKAQLDVRERRQK